MILRFGPGGQERCKGTVVTGWIINLPIYMEGNLSNVTDRSVPNTNSRPKFRETLNSGSAW